MTDLSLMALALHGAGRMDARGHERFAHERMCLDVLQAKSGEHPSLRIVHDTMAELLERLATLELGARLDAVGSGNEEAPFAAVSMAMGQHGWHFVGHPLVMAGMEALGWDAKTLIERGLVADAEHAAQLMGLDFLVWSKLPWVRSISKKPLLVRVMRGQAVDGCYHEWGLVDGQARYRANGVVVAMLDALGAAWLAGRPADEHMAAARWRGMGVGQV